MKTVYIVLETVDVETTGVRIFSNIKTAHRVFEECAEENSATESEFSQIKKELEGTLRFAGDDTYAVQLVERVVLTGNKKY